MPTGTLKRLVKTPISMPTLEEHTLRLLKIKPLGTRFVDFWSQCKKVIESNFLGLVFSTSGTKTIKSSNRASWHSFCRLLEPRPESHQIDSPGTSFVDFLIQGQKVMKSSFLGFVFSTSGAKARKSSNRVSWDSFRLIGTWYRHNITSEEHFIIGSSFIGSPHGHLFVVPPSTHRASGGPTRNTCLRKSVSIIIGPLPLSHHRSFCCLQSRCPTKCSVLKE